jgi:hypothetical protein
MASGIASKESILVLQTHQVEIAGIEKVGGGPIGGDVTLDDLESHARGVDVGGFRIIDGYHRQSSGAVLGSDRIAQIGRESGNSTLAGKMVPHHRYP